MMICDFLRFTGILRVQPLIDSTLTADADIGRFLHPGEPPGQSGDLHRQRTFADFSEMKFESQSILAKNRGTPKSSIFNGGFPLFSPSILGVKSPPYFWFNTPRVGAGLAVLGLGFQFFLRPKADKTNVKTAAPSAFGFDRFCEWDTIHVD